jgi:hypothetical protein
LFTLLPGTLVLDSGSLSGTDTDAFITLFSASANAGLNLIQLIGVITANTLTTNNTILTLGNSQAAPTSPILQITTSAAADKSVGIQISTDTTQRLAIDSNGKLQWGPGGSTATDTALSRSAANQLETGGSLLFDGIGTAAAPAVGKAVLQSDTSGFLRWQTGLAGDNNIYELGEAHLFSTATPQVISSTSYVTVTGLSCTVGIGTYRLDAELICTNGAAISQADIRSGGTCAWTGRLNAVTLGSASTVIGVSSANAAGGVMGSGVYSNGITYVMRIRGKLTVSTAGTLTLDAALHAAGQTVTVVDAFLDLAPAN